jgi:Fe2+ or Zn2+ uptake regulation protein
MMATRVSSLRKKKALQDRCNTPHAVELRAPHERSDPPRTARYATVEATPPQNLEAGYLEQQLLARGIRLTGQRRCVLSAIENSPQCRNVGVIHRRARKLNSAVHRVTVYRTLALLERYGLLLEPCDLKACAGESSCPRAGECEQIQMKCLHCGKSVEFKSCMVDDLMRCVERDCRFRVSQASVDIAGYCQNCRV